MENLVADPAGRIHRKRPRKPGKGAEPLLALFLLLFQALRAGGGDGPA